MGVFNFSRCCLVIFFVFTGFRSLGSSPIPQLQDYLNRRSSALPAGDKGQLSQQTHGLINKRSILMSTLEPPSSLDNLADSSKHPSHVTELKSLNAQGGSDMPKDSAGKQPFLQLSASRESSKGGPDLNSAPRQQNSNDLQSLSSAQQSWQLLPIKPKQEIDTQSQKETKNIPPNPVVHSEDSNQASNSVLSSPQTQLPEQSDLPLKNGHSLINLGPINLKTDWCTENPFKETVRHHGCTSVSVDNNMCYGQCNSFYIPKRFVSCSYCAASKLETINVRLECPGQNPDFIMKKVTIVKACRCKDCGLANP